MHHARTKPMNAAVFIYNAAIIHPTNKLKKKPTAANNQNIF
jgi:hypothetical protein